MDAALAVGRVLLVGLFIFSGFVKFVDISGTAAHIADKGLPMPAVLAVAAGAVEVICGLMVAVGWHTRVAAVALLLFSAVAAFFFHDFWNLPPGREQIGQMLHAWKNLSMIGGLLVVAAAGPGRFSIDARARISAPASA
jgi:putative oxidoreductase